jgi:dephospho-CoA kinase
VSDVVGHDGTVRGGGGGHGAVGNARAIGPAATARDAPPLRIGLTGPIGCGKSTIARWLADAGGTAIDADAVARDVTARGEPAVAAIGDRFGAGVIAADGSLDRSALAAIVFADPVALRDLEAIVHPTVRLRILDAFAAAEASGAPFVVVEAIRLVEGGLAAACDEVWLVTCTSRAQRARMVERGLSAAEIDRRIAAQSGLAERAGLVATRVLDASGSREETAAVVAAALRDARARRP